MRIADGAEPEKKRERSAKPWLVVQFHPAPPPQIESFTLPAVVNFVLVPGADLLSFQSLLTRATTSPTEFTLGAFWLFAKGGIGNGYSLDSWIDSCNPTLRKRRMGHPQKLSHAS
jgi:hypothetical protein